MKRLVLSIALLALFILPAYAQRTCGSELDLQTLQKTNPERYQRLLRVEQRVADYLRATEFTRGGTDSIITIPVVVHVLHTGQAVGTGLNISMAQIQSQIDVLNEDFRRLNADASNTPVDFQGVAADPRFEFVLACKDPNGDPTNGVVRVQTSTSTFHWEPDSSDPNAPDEAAMGIKFAPTGSPAWPSDRYLNIWVCKLGGNLLGYAQFPDELATKPDTDGVVIHTTAFGRTGNVASPFDEGRTATHEIGHWMGLWHIFGSAPGCGNGDFVADTPNQDTYRSGCPSHPQSSCSSYDMFMNYMDYTNDACMNIFTEGQAQRMRSFFQPGNERASFVTCNTLAQVCTTPPTISGSSLVCASGTQFTLNNVPTGATVTWQIQSNKGLTSPSGSGNTATVTFNPSLVLKGTRTVVFTITPVCGDPFDVQRTFFLGDAVNIEIVTLNPNPQQLCPLEKYYRVPYLPDVTYQWTVTGSYYTAWFLYGENPPNYQENAIYVLTTSSASFDISVTMSTSIDSCVVTGTLTSQTGNGIYCDCYYDPGVCPEHDGLRFSIYPNPANTSITIEPSDGSVYSSRRETPDQPYQVQLISTPFLETVYAGEATGQETVIQTRHLPEGTYFLIIRYKDAVIRKQIMIKR